MANNQETGWRLLSEGDIAGARAAADRMTQAHESPLDVLSLMAAIHLEEDDVDEAWKGFGSLGIAQGKDGNALRSLNCVLESSEEEVCMCESEQ